MKTFHYLKVVFFLIAAVSLSSCSSSHSRSELSSQAVFSAAEPASYRELLARYVTPQGVDYQQWSRSSADLSQLSEVSRYYATHQPPAEEQSAFAWYLNAYNAWILQRILSDWPNEGPLDASLLFFHKKSIVVSGKSMSLLHLENEVIRKKFSDPRLHFALNCASRSCPPLHNEPFEGRNLDRVLESLTNAFLNENPQALQETESEVRLSKIFKWYEEDFGGRENLVPFINRYRKEPLSLSKEVSFLVYDWQLNAQF